MPATRPWRCWRAGTRRSRGRACRCRPTPISNCRSGWPATSPGSPNRGSCATRAAGSGAPARPTRRGCRRWSRWPTAGTSPCWRRTTRAGTCPSPACRTCAPTCWTRWSARWTCWTKATPDDDGPVLLPRGAVPRGPARRAAAAAGAGAGLAMPVRLPPPAAAARAAAAAGHALDAGRRGARLRVRRRARAARGAGARVRDRRPAVSWEQYVEFVDDGGYDREDLWQPEGWQWLQKLARAEGRRGLAMSSSWAAAAAPCCRPCSAAPPAWPASRRCCTPAGGRPTPMRAGPGAACRPKSNGRSPRTRRAAAGSAGARSGNGRRAPCGRGRASRPTRGRATPSSTPASVFGQARVLRGASFATRSRLRWPRRRAWALPGRDDLFVGFRTCAV
jgi:iron(II)-dependent oxidoreductase